MPETVGIVLNERESSKAEIAAQLEQVLTSKGITTFRYSIESQIKETLYQKRPPILILDYILGDYSTGLDVLEELKSLPDHERPQIFFLTDEPSASVATSAMRGGALHYLNIDSPHSVPELVEEIEKLRNTQKKIIHELPAYEKVDDLIFESKAMRFLQSAMQIAISEKATLPLFIGDAGSGKKTLARAYMQALGFDSLSLSEVDMRFCLEDAEALLKIGQRKRCLLLHHIEADDGELLELLSQQKELLHLHSDTILVLATTSDPETATAWQNLVGGPVLQLPALSERKDDFSPLVQKFTREAAKLFDTKLSPPSSSIIDTLSQKAWSHGISQLREVLLSAYQSAQKSDDDFAEILDQQYEYSQRYASEHALTQQPSKSLLHLMLEKHRYRYRIVAAKLGISLSEINNILHEADT